MMMFDGSRLARGVQLMASLYAFITILFTAIYLLASLFRPLFSLPLPSTAAFPWTLISGFRPVDSQLAVLQESVIHWNISANGEGSTSVQNGMFPLQEELFLSKLFGNSFHPTKIIPFFYRATGTFDQEDITITTLVTSNRFKVFANLVERYQGPISVTIHVNNSTKSMHDLLDELHALYISSPTMARYVDVHLVVDSFDRQFNTWRNIARFFARTDFIMMLDIDFYLCTDFRSAMRNSEMIMNKLRQGTAAFVIPAFEYTNHVEGTHYSRFPRDKNSLISLVKTKKIRIFHAFWELGHNSTDYLKYYSSSPGEVYKVTQYQSAYEPYVVFKKDGPPWCDERFVGYGGNKAACLFEMYLSGISFYVLSDHFIIHQNHLYDESARRGERQANRKLYQQFKEETCLRYLKGYHESGILNTTRGFNVQDECKKIKGLSRVAAQLIDPPYRLRN
ncbi:glycosyl-transferase for dystroglycan-domain-containing protein [Mycena floridula]|nr:glycosyl-transferase for dystroglycan-domain-containing protein [Mycena floridula]